MSRAERIAMIDRGARVSLNRQCQLLGVSKSSINYKPKQESAKNESLMRLMDKQYLRTPFYGVRRMHQYLKSIPAGYGVNEKRIRRLFKKMDLRAIGPSPNTTKSDPTKYKYPYLLRNLTVTKSNQVWAIDITYIPMFRGHMYLFAIIDLHSRCIVGWSLSNTMTSKWCVDCIKQAIQEHGKPEIINSDQGVQFTSKLYTEFLQCNDIKISMDGKGRAIDNIFIERFWRSIKQEYVYIEKPNGGYELSQGIEEYIRYYNNERMHQSLNNLTPADVFYKLKPIFKQTKYRA